VVALKFVSKSFTTKNSARSRTYEYLFPINCLKKMDHLKDKSNEELVKMVDDLLQLFTGSKNYHNYTKKIEFKSDQAMRHMMQLTTDLITMEEIPLVKITLFGQSFLYHQIRKMVGAIIQSLVTEKDSDLILNSFAANKMNIWLAPSSGLLLDQVLFYISLNQRCILTDTTPKWI
jgi:tRNA pseudouridine38-40 synthase